MHHHHRLYLYATTLFAITGPAFASYVIEPLSVQDTFTPVTITDDRYVAGTIVTAHGSLAMITNGTDTRTYDFCGSKGAADKTVLAGTSPYSVNRYLAGTCGYVSGFIYDVARKALTAIPNQSTGTVVTAVGPGGLAAGIADPHSGGDYPFYYKNGQYGSFYPGEFSNITQITGNGTIVGFWQNSGGLGSGFTLKRGGTLVNVPPPNYSYDNYAFLYGGNCHDQFVAVVVASSIPYGGPPTVRAAVWQAGQYTYPPLPANTVSSDARAINEKGDVAGVYTDTAGMNHVFIWHTSVAQIDIIPFPPGAQAVSVSSINNHADLTGTYTSTSLTQAYRAIRHP